ncbi:MAG: hypothetical protein KAR38_13190, partial [Calditrichia bacterium]|nr:hypothetical protein [Calditrichia bacterium]
MWKKTGIILGGIALIWIVMVIALMIIYNSTRKFEDLIQDKILSSLPDSSNVFLGKINGNLFSQIEIDSSYFQIDHSTAISFNKVKITHKLISYFSGIPQIKEIRIIKPQILLMKKEKKDSAVVLPKKFSLEETVIPFEKIFPENIHEVLQNTFKKIPSLQIDKIILDQLYIKKEGENLFTEGRIELKISPGLISLQKLRGNLLDRIPLKNISMDCKYDETSFLINNINFQTPNSTLKGKLDVEFEKRLNGLWIIDSLVINEEALKNIFPKSKKTFQNVNISSAGYIYFYPDSIYFDISPAGYFNEIHIDSSKISGKLGKTSLQIKEIKIWSPDGFLEGKMLTGFKLKTWLEINIRKF